MIQYSAHTQRIIELEELAASEGITLPWPAAVIAEFEDSGHIIDLRTDLVIEHGAQQRIIPTTVAEAELYVATILGGIPL